MKEIKEIPEITTQCPANSNRAVSVNQTCTKCRFFKAVACINKDERVPWGHRHNIICLFPRRLAVTDMVKTEDAINKIESLTVSKLIES